MSHHYIRFNNVHYAYPNGYKALNGINFEIKHGEKVALIGSNGAGKSTLILHTNGILQPSQGNVTIGDIPIVKKTLPTIRKTVGLIFQNSDDQLFMPTVEEDIAFGLLNMGLPPVEVERRILKTLTDLGIAHLRKSSTYLLSGGQKRLVAIATVLAMEPDMLIMDEPSSNLDPKARRQIIELVRTFTHTCLIATHDLDMAYELCPRTIIIQNGEVIRDGYTSEIFDNKELLEYCGLEQPGILKYRNHEDKQ